MYPTQTSKTQSAVRPVPALTRATHRASRIQPTTSFPTPAESTITPTLVPSNLSSVKIRHRTGNAFPAVSKIRRCVTRKRLTVIAIAIPIKSKKVPKLISTVSGSSWKVLYSPYAMAQPKPKGKIMPAADTLTATRQLLTRKRRLVSSPTRNRKSTNPRLATKFRLGIEAVGNMASVKPGIRPITEGPSMTPAMTSAITRGWRILESGQCSRRQNMMIMPAWSALAV